MYNEKKRQEENRLKRTHFICFMIALLLAVLAVPAFAEPDEIETATDPYAVTQEGATAVPGFSIEPRLPGEGETEPEGQTFIAATPYATEPETTIGIVPISDTLPEAAPGLFSQRNLTYGALGVSCLALLLSILALARTRRKTAPNATGNYQKYF